MPNQTRRLLFPALALAISAVTLPALAAGTGGGFAGGVVGGTKPPATKAAATLPSGPAPIADWVPKPKTFPPVPKDPIERPEFAAKPHPLTKSITTATAMMVIMDPEGGEIGLTSDVNADVVAESRKGTTSTASFVTKQATVGKDMTVSFDEAVRAVKLRYPYWEPGKIEFSFGEKYTAHEGGSAGTCFAVMLLSELEGFDIDPKCAVTGDISVNWKVLKIGGTAAKVRGATADKCLYACVPVDNGDEIADMYLLNGYESLRDIQVFTIPTLQDAVATLRTDRAPQLVEAMQEFSDMQAHIKSRASLSTPDVQKALDQILALAPNNLSAKLLQQIGKGTAPTKLTMYTALDEFFGALNPYKEIIMTGKPPSRADLPAAQTAATRKRFDQLRPILPPELSPLMVDATAIVNTADQIANKANISPATWSQRLDNFSTHLDALRLDKSVREKLLR